MSSSRSDCTSVRTAGLAPHGHVVDLLLLEDLADLGALDERGHGAAHLGGGQAEVAPPPRAASAR